MNTNVPLDLRKLRHAIVLAELGTFARASRELYITQSALTRSIQALESDLGIKLFERLPNGIRPTIVGASLLQRAQSLLLQANGLRHDARLFRDARLGTLIFGIGPMLLEWVEPIVSALARESPQLDIRIEIEPVHRLQEMLLAEDLEFLVADVSQLAQDPRLVQKKIGAMQISYFVRRGHPLVRRRDLIMPEIQKFPLIAPGFHRLSDAVIETAGWRGRISCESIDMLKSVALNSDGVVLAATAAIAHELNAKKLVQLRLREPRNWVSDVRIVALADRNRSPLAQRVIGELTSMAQKLA